MYGWQKKIVLVINLEGVCEHTWYNEPSEITLPPSNRSREQV